MQRLLSLLTKLLKLQLLLFATFLVPILISCSIPIFVIFSVLFICFLPFLSLAVAILFLSFVCFYLIVLGICYIGDRYENKNKFNFAALPYSVQEKIFTKLQYKEMEVFDASSVFSHNFTLNVPKAKFMFTTDHVQIDGNTLIFKSKFCWNLPPIRRREDCAQVRLVVKKKVNVTNPLDDDLCSYIIDQFAPLPEIKFTKPLACSVENLKKMIKCLSVKKVSCFELDSHDYFKEDLNLEMLVIKEASTVSLWNLLSMKANSVLFEEITDLTSNDITLVIQDWFQNCQSSKMKKFQGDYFTKEMIGEAIARLDESYVVEPQGKDDGMWGIKKDGIHSFIQLRGWRIVYLTLTHAKDK